MTWVELWHITDLGVWLSEFGCRLREYLGKGEIESKLADTRQRTHTGRPLGTAEFINLLRRPYNGG